MSELKYLSDGRKVSVIGKINKTEYIVQEIFITANGDEIPSGENFTTKSLHDSPVLSWKEKETEKYESKYEKVRSEISTIEKELRVMKGKRQGHVDILNQNEKLISLLDECNFDGLTDVLMGNIKYVVGTCSYAFRVQTFEDGIFYWENSYGDRSYKGLKMISLFALQSSPYRSDRRCSVSISEYTDGSGNERGFKFFKDDKELSLFLTEEVEGKYKDGKLTLEIIKEASKYITVPKVYIDEIKATKRKAAEDYYKKNQKDNKDRLNKSLEEIN